MKKRTVYESTPLGMRAFGLWGARAALAGAAFAVMGAGGAQAITLEQAVRDAVDTNPDVGVVATDRRAVEQELEQAYSLYYPSLDARFAVGPEWTHERAGELPGSANRRQRMTRQESSLTLTQMLFDGYEAASEVQRQKARTASAALRVTETAEFIGLDAVQAYLDVLRQQILLGIAGDNVRAHERTLSDMQERLRGGTGGVADVRQAESRLARARATVAETRGVVQDSEANFIRIVGEAPSGLLRPPPIDHLLPANVDMAVAQAIETNPTIAIAKADIKTAQAELRASRADFFPEIDLEVSYSRDRNLNKVQGRSSDYMALVVARWNLFRGFNTMALNQEFVERLAEAHEVLSQTERRAEEEARLSWSALQTARERTAALQAQVTANQSVRDAYMEQFNLGQRSLLDVLDAENELFVSRGDLVTAEFVEIFAGYRILATGGLLLENMGISPPPESVVAGVDIPETNIDDVALAYGSFDEEISEQPAIAEAEGIEPAAGAEEGAVEGEPAAGVEEGAVEGETVAGIEEGAAEGEMVAGADMAVPDAPTEGFKEAEGEVADDTLLSLNFNPLWSLD